MAIHPTDWKGRFDALLDWTNDPEDCEACWTLEDVCPYHLGRAHGVQWMSEHLARIADDPEVLNGLATRTAASR